MIGALPTVLSIVAASLLRSVGYAREAAFGLGMGGVLNIALDPPFMFLSFHIVYFMQAVDRGRVSFYLAVIRQLCLNIPILFLFNALFGMTGIVWTQMTADILNTVVSYVIYFRVLRNITEETNKGRLGP